jgi:hypothetical protein
MIAELASTTIEVLKDEKNQEVHIPKDALSCAR